MNGVVAGGCAARHHPNLLLPLPVALGATGRGQGVGQHLWQRVHLFFQNESLCPC